MKFKIVESKQQDYIAIRLYSVNDHGYYKEYNYIASETINPPYVFMERRRKKAIKYLKKEAELYLHPKERALLEFEL